MLTALHITLPPKRVHRESQQHLPNRCLVVNESTCEASLISTEASLKYATGAAHESCETGTRFRFGHVTISPHHGSIFVTQVAPLLYDLCRSFWLSACCSDAASQSQPSVSKSAVDADSDAPNIPQSGWENLSWDECRKVYQKTWSMSRSVFIYGSHSATERRALFLHLAKATALALRQEADAMGAQPPERNECDVAFSLVDLYHVWGVGDVLDPNAVMHDDLRLQRLKREEPRRSLNEPKGIDFVAPTRQALESRDSVSTCIMRALQRSAPPRALRTSAEKEEHAVNSTLVLTFFVSRRSKRGPGVSRRGRMPAARAEEERGRQKIGCPTEARFHLILLPDSTAAAHGKQGAQELGALASALQACTQWQKEMLSAEDDSRTQRANGVPVTARNLDASSSATASATSKLPWVPLRESSLLLYLFESNMYYRHQLEKSLRNLRLSKERRRPFGDGSRSVSANVSTQSLDVARSVSYSTAVSTEQSGCWMCADANGANVLDCIAAGIGQCLLVLCVNSGWDQYYQARTAFLFAQRATKQLDQPCVFLEPKSEEVSHTFSAEQVRGNSHKPSPLASTAMQSPYQCARVRHLQGPLLSLEGSVAGVERQLWSSPRRREATQPRPPEAAGPSDSPLAPSEVAVVEEEGSDRDADLDAPSQRTEAQVVRQRVGSGAAAGTKITSPIAPSPEARIHSGPVQQLFRCDRVDQQAGISSLGEETAANSGQPRGKTGGSQGFLPRPGPCGSTASAEDVSLCPPPAERGAMVNDVLLKQSLLLQENAELRALLARLSSQQADTYRGQRESTRIADVCDAALLESRRTARSSELDALRKELSTTTKKARVLQKTLSRSVDDNRKLCRVMHAQMKQCLLDLSRIFQGSLGERDLNFPAIAEERIRRWEKLLEKTTRQVLRPFSGASRAEEEAETPEEEEEEEATCADSGDGVCPQRCQPKRVTKTSHANSACALLSEGRPSGSCCNGRHHQKRREADVLPGAKAEGRDRQAPKRYMKEEVKSPLGSSITPQLAQLLQLAYRLFLCDSSSTNEDDENGGHNAFGGSLQEGPDGAKVEAFRTTHQSLSRSVLDILSPHQQEARAGAARAEIEGRPVTGRRPEAELCWRCQLSRRPRCNAAYTKFLEILRSLCRQQVTITGEAPGSHPQVMKETEEEELKGMKGASFSGHAVPPSGPCCPHEGWEDVSAAGLLRNEGALLLKTRQLSDSLQKNTDTRAKEQAAVRSLQSELEKEREWRRQLQDELLNLRLRLSKYESKFAFIGETVKPKISQDIAQLEQKISERKKQEDLERQRRAAFMSEIKKRLQRVSAEDDLMPLRYSSSSPLSPRQ
ncbi:uncharacterized protein Tco025E_03417 [Trypanosoma conorhini]|uniref:Uncharacterized protein n=1 Tax=Trypanosoma conorhini TaxID=83891 RepID=A0A422PVQ8_9TRYP|nr:uncharacterized protein Tco025E_03417 [Trypanosoma conorhini]RNF21792.1 hypothetical protein Tco025E_03417 [Trypanosoma conorhini]